MKKIILTILLSFSLMLGFAVPRYTSDYYIADAEKYLDKEVTLRIAFAELETAATCIEELKQEGYVVFFCRSYYNNEYGGSPRVIVPEKKAKSFASNFNISAYQKRKNSAAYKAIMRKKDDTYYFEGK